MKKLALITLVLVLRCETVSALGGDYPCGIRLLVPTNYPAGLADLRDHKSRVHGYFVNMEDLFFYVGDTAWFNLFLTNYAALPIASHKLALHRGSGTTKSPWNHRQGVRCDWKLYIAPAWRKPQFEAKKTDDIKEIIRRNPGYVVSLELWLNGGVDFTKVRVPANVTVVPADEESKQ
jgi:hypothetical protein